jgi:hypothetical protein
MMHVLCLLLSALFPVNICYHLTLCPIQRLLYLTLLPVNVFYYSTLCPIWHLLYLTLFPVNIFSFSTFFPVWSLLPSFLRFNIFIVFYNIYNT